jgi:hypothetical protein
MIKNAFTAFVTLLVVLTYDQHFAAGWCTEAAITVLVQLRHAFG